jgi:hypothetical protein
LKKVIEVITIANNKKRQDFGLFLMLFKLFFKKV